MTRKTHIYKIFSVAWFATLCVYVSNAQDPHFSQYFNNPLFVNPATCGNGINYVRAVALYRNQWATVTTPFTTEDFAIDKAVTRFGFGAIVTNQHSGNAGIHSLNILGTIAYHQPIGQDNLNKISIGLQVGMNQKSFDPSKMTFDDQYAADAGYNPNQPTSEIFSETKISTPDLNVALHWQKGWGNEEIKFKPYAGVTAFHVNQPKESFIVDNNRLPIKYVGTAGAGYKLNDQLELKPSVVFMKQDNFSETTFGVQASFSPDHSNTFQLGAYHRLNDAVIVYAGYQVKTVFLGISYDMNTSSLSKSSKGANAFEVSLTYVPTGKNRKHQDEDKKEAKPEEKKEKAKNEKRKTQEKQKEKTQEKATERKIETVMPENKNAKSVVAENTKNEKAGAEKLSDRDGDGVPDKFDQCPDVFGEIYLHGCPDDDQDADGVKDKDDKCPTEAGIKELNGCPDTDGDGITDKEDRCPYQAGPKSNNGCPASDIDADGDGVPDKIDPCPFIKGGIKTNGCPDSDGDGIIDSEDPCPFTRGNNHGCPDENVLPVKFENLEFDLNSARIRLDHFYPLEHTIDSLFDNSSWTIIISGHTDGEGNEMYNMMLSQNRADAVKNYLVSHGIAATRIRTIGYGENKPLMSNETDEGRKHNRRAEINIIKE